MVVVVEEAPAGQAGDEVEQMEFAATASKEQWLASFGLVVAPDASCTNLF